MVRLIHEIAYDDVDMNGDLIEKQVKFGDGTDIINPKHIVNVMSNNMESPQAEVEFVNHSCNIQFFDYKDRLTFLDAIYNEHNVSIKIKKLSNRLSRWLKA